MSTRRQDGPQQAPAVRRRIEPVVGDLGLVLEDVSVTTAGTRSVLRVVLDLPPDGEGALSLDAVAAAAREISTVLDAADPMGQSPYTLEVSSPGVDRPLTEPRHLRRNVGRVVLLTLHDESTVTGRVLSVEDDDTLVLLLPGAKKGMPATKQRRVGWDEVVQGVVQVEFSRQEGATDVQDDGLADDDDEVADDDDEVDGDEDDLEDDPDDPEGDPDDEAQTDDTATDDDPDDGRS